MSDAPDDYLVLLRRRWDPTCSPAEAQDAIAAQNPCMACGPEYEVRPVELRRASAYVQANETPAA